MAKTIRELQLEKQGKSVLNSAEEENKVSQIESILAGIGSGLIQIPKGIFSLGATLIDLGADTNKAAAVEKWFDDLTTLDEKAAATTAGKITELLVNIGVPGGIGFKVGSKLAQTALTSKKAGKYFGLVDKANNKILVDSTTKLAKLNAKGRTARFAAGAITGGAMEGVFIGDVEAAGTFGNLLGGPTRLHETIEGDNDPARALANRVKFGTEGALFTGVIGGLGKTLGLIARRNEARRFADNKMDKFLFDFAKRFQKEGGTTKQFFKSQREIIGAKYSDVNYAQEYARGLTKDIDGLFPLLQRWMDKSTRSNRKDFLKVLDEGLVSGIPRVMDDGSVRFGEKITREIFDPLTKSTSKQIGYGGINKSYIANAKKFLKKNKINYKDEQLATIFERMENMRNAWGGMFSDLGRGIKKGSTLNKKFKKSFKEFKKIFGDKFKDYLGNTYEIFQNRSLIPLFTKPISTEIAEKAAREMMKIAQINKTPIVWQEALDAVDSIARSAAAPKNFNEEMKVGVPNFFSTKSMAGKAKLTELTPLEREVVEGILGKTEDPIQTILSSTAQISATTRKNQLVHGLAQSSRVILGKNANNINKQTGLPDVAKNGLRPLLYDSYEQAMAKARELGDSWDKSMYRIIKSFDRADDITNPVVGKIALKEVADAFEFAAGRQYEGVFNNNLYKNLILLPKATAQMAKTILSIFTHARNFISAGAFSVANGLIPGVNITPKIASQAWRSLQVTTGLGTRDVNYQELYRKLARLGVVNTNVRLGDMASLLKDVDFGTVIAADRALSGMFKPLSKLKNWTQDAYTAEDDFWKISTFLAERARLAKAYQTAGVKLGKNALDEEAANIVRNNVPNYDYVSQFVKDFRRYPIGNFVSFPAEILRTSSNILQRALHEIKTPALRKIGYQRLLGMGFTMAAVPAGAVSMGQWLYNISEDELQAIKRYVPSWSANSTIVPLRGKDITDFEKEGGDFKYIDFSHANAYDTLLKPWQGAINQVAAGNIDDKEIMNNFLLGALKGFGDIAQPFVSESMYTEALSDIIMRVGKTREGYEVWNEKHTLGEKADRAFLHLLKTQMPGSLKQLGRIDYALTATDTFLQEGSVLGGGPYGNWKWGKIGKYDENGQSYELLDEGLGISGMRAVDVNVARGLTFKQAAYASGSRKSKSLFNKVALKEGPRDPEELTNAFIKANNALFEVQQAMGEDIRAAKTLKIKPAEMYESLARLSRKDLGNLEAGIFEPYTPSRDVIDGMYRNARKMGLPNPYNKIAFAINNILRKLYRLRIKKGSTFPQFINPFSVKKIQEQETIEKISNVQGDVTTNLQSNVMPPPGSTPANTNLAYLSGQVGADGLKPSERAFLPPDEQQYYREQRGIG